MINKQSLSQPSTYTNSTISTYTPIPQPELRGINLNQLRALCKEIHYRCDTEDWKRSIQGVSISLEPEEVNFNDLNANFVIPQTKHHACSYVELVASKTSTFTSQRRKPEWFVSHWWGIPVFDVVRCLEQQAFDRNLDPETTPFWICALAHSQHSQHSQHSPQEHTVDNIDSHQSGENRYDEEYGDEYSQLIDTSDLTQSSFYRALRLCKGVISILDRESFTFSRLWCNFEMSLALCSNLENTPLYDGKGEEQSQYGQDQAIYQTNSTVSRYSHYSHYSHYTNDNNESGTYNQDRILFDVYTRSHNGQPVGLTDGIVASDIYPRRDDGKLDMNAKTLPSNYNGMKLIRESQFPHQVCINALSIQVETSNATREIDRIQILNFIAKMNRSSGGSSHSYLYTASTGSSDSILSDAQRQPPLTHPTYTHINKFLRCKFATTIYSRCLEEGKNVDEIRKTIEEAPIEELELSFHSIRQAFEEVPKLVKSLPTSLKAIDFRFSMQLFQTSADFAIGFRRLTKLQVFKLDCSMCTLTSCTHLWKEIQTMENIEILDLNFSFNQYLRSIEGLGKAIINLPYLKELRLNFERCSNIDSIEDLIKGLSFIGKSKSSSLRVLDLNFNVTSLREYDVIDLCNELIMSPILGPDNALKLRLSFEPLLNLEGVENIRDLKRLINSCCSVYCTIS